MHLTPLPFLYFLPLSISLSLCFFCFLSFSLTLSIFLLYSQVYEVEEVTEDIFLAEQKRDREQPATNAVLLHGLIAKRDENKALELLSKEPCDLTMPDAATGGTALTAAIDKALPLSETHTEGESERERPREIEKGLTSKPFSLSLSVVCLSVCHMDHGEGGHSPGMEVFILFSQFVVILGLYPASCATLSLVLSHPLAFVFCTTQPNLNFWFFLRLCGQRPTKLPAG